MVLKEETTLEKTVKPSEAQHFLNDFDNKSEEINVDHETDEKINVNLTFLISIDPKDYCEITLDDAIKDKTHPLITKWMCFVFYSIKRQNTSTNYKMAK